MNIGGYYIGFAGNSHLRNFDVDSEHRMWRILAEQIGKEIIQRDHRLVTGGCSGGLTELCVKSAKNWLEDHDRDIEQELRIVSIVSREKPPTVNVGRVLVCEDWSRDQRRVCMASLENSLITVGGVEGTTREGQCALCIGTPLIPIWGTGGSSLRLWQQIQKEFKTHPLYESFITSDTWKALGPECIQSPKKSAASAVDLAVTMAEQKIKLYSRQLVASREGDAPFRVFVLMPFDPAFYVVYREIQAAFTSSPIREILGGHVECNREDETRTGQIDESVIKHIREADMLVADLTGNNGNVLFEYGYGLALRKKIILLSQHPEDTKADLRNQKQIKYDSTRFGKNKSASLKLELLAAAQELTGVQINRTITDTSDSKNMYEKCEAVKNGFNCIFRKTWQKRTEGYRLSLTESNRI